MSSSPSLFFYDLETSGIHADSARIMQFAGQRVDLDLNPVGEPINLLIKLSEDILPDPYSVLIHGIAPQQTILEGLSEEEFLKEFYSSVVQPDTTFVGFNNVRFDDEFMRFLNYRNLYDPYAWAWENGNSRWDMLDVTRMIRAISPDGIDWPTDEAGKNTNRLELLAKANNLKHTNAHDALSDVEATISLTRLIKERNPELFASLFKMRLKVEAGKLINSNQPFIYTSSHYSSEYLHSTVALKVADNLPSNGSVLVYDLRFDPSNWLKLSTEQLASAWRYEPKRDQSTNPSLPVKTLRLNRCPAIQPIDIENINSDLAKRLKLNRDKIKQHEQILKDKAVLVDFGNKLNEALEILNDEQSIRHKKRSTTPDMRLYDGFYSDDDRKLLKSLHNGDEMVDKVRELRHQFSDPRLRQLCSFYLARNFKKQLTSKERQGWEDYLSRRLLGGGENSALSNYFKQIAQLKVERSDSRSQVLLEDLRLYGESLIPASSMEA